MKHFFASGLLELVTMNIVGPFPKLRKMISHLCHDELLPQASTGSHAIEKDRYTRRKTVRGSLTHSIWHSNVLSDRCKTMNLEQVLKLLELVRR